MMKKILQAVVSIILICAIIMNIGVDKITIVLSGINTIYLIPVFLVYLTMNFFLAFRIQFLLKRLGSVVNFTKVFFSHMFGMLWSEITPGKSGYISVVFPLKKINVPASRTISTLGVVQIGDFIVKIIGTLFALFLLSTILLDVTNYALLGVGTAIVLIALISIVLWSEKTDKLFSFLKKFKLGRKIHKILPHIRKSSSVLKKNFVFVIAISLIGWLFRGAEWYFLGGILGMNLGFMVFLLLHPLLTLLSFVPISPAGIGIMEGGSILILTLFGVPPEVAFTFAILSRVTNIFVDLLGIKEIFQF